MDVLEQARAYVAAGISVAPLRLDGSKATTIQWGHLRDRLATDEELVKWFTAGRAGIAALCGKASGGLEVLDHDGDGFFVRWRALGKAEGLDFIDDLPIVQTGKPWGRHVYYRVAECSAGEKLAQLEDGQTAIEFRGEGQYVVAPGSPATVHESGNEYRLIFGPPIVEVPTITAEQRDRMHALARALTLRVDERQIVGRRQPKDGVGLLPGHDYSVRGDWRPLLERHGWELAHDHADGVEHWRRPGKDRGISASLGKIRGDHGERLFFVFSTSVPPLEAGHAYTLFAATAYLDHGGNFKTAATALRKEGYGRDPTEEEVLAAVETTIGGLRAVLLRSPDDGAVALEQEVGRDMLCVFLENSQQFKRVWDHRRRDLLSQTEHDAAIVYWATQEGLGLYQVVGLVLLDRRRRDISTDDVDHRALAGLIFRARRAPSEAELLREIVVDTAKAGGRETVLADLRARIKIPELARIVQRGTTAAQFALEMTDGKQVDVGSVDVLMSYRRMRNRLFEALRIYIPEALEKRWGTVASLCLEVIDVEDIEELTLQRRMDDLIDLYCHDRALIDVGLSEENLAALIVRLGPFVRGEELHISAVGLSDWLAVRRLAHDLQAKVPQVLRACGFRPTTVGTRVNGRSVARRYYVRFLAGGAAGGA